jgi:hypothetical protein
MYVRGFLIPHLNPLLSNAKKNYKNNLEKIIRIKPITFLIFTIVQTIEFTPTQYNVTTTNSPVERGTPEGAGNVSAEF